MGAMFIGQQFLQNVLGYSTVDAGAAILPAAIMMVLIAPRSAKLVESQRRPLHAAGRLRLLPARLRHDAAAVGRGRRLLAGRPRLRLRRRRRRLRRHPRLPLAHRLGAGHPGRHGVGHRRPPARPRRRHHAVDPRRPPHRRLRGRHRRGRSPPPRTPTRSPTASSRSCRSPSPSAEGVAEQYPQYASQITAAAKTSFLDGADWAYVAGIVAILLGAALVFFMFPRRDDEARLLARVRRRGHSGHGGEVTQSWRLASGTARGSSTPSAAKWQHYAACRGRRIARSVRSVGGLIQSPSRNPAFALPSPPWRSTDP